MPETDVEAAPVSRAEYEALQAQLAALQQMQPKFVKLPPGRQRAERTYVPPEQLRARAARGLAQGQSTQGSAQWLDTPNGRASLPDAYRPAFRPGDLVTLNPDATLFGSDKTWGSVLDAQHRRPEEVGEVMNTMFITKSWEPKYKVSFVGLGVFGARESELLPA